MKNIPELVLIPRTVKASLSTTARIIQTFLATVLCFSLLLGFVSLGTVKAAGEISVSGPGSATVGSTVSVSVTVGGGGPFSSFDGSFSYDSSLLSLQSISSGNYTKVNFDSSGNNFLEYNATIPNGTLIVTATFNCIAAGSAKVSSSLSGLGDINGNELGGSSASTTIKISAPTPKSDNANLSSLQISPGSLSPKFSTGTQNYSATVSQSQMTVSATAEDGKASVALNGVQNNLKVGANTVKVTVTAESGATKTYTINVTRNSSPSESTTATSESGENTPTPAETSTEATATLPQLTLGNQNWQIMTPGDGDTIPEGFVLGTASYSGQSIPAVVREGEANPAFSKVLVLLESEGKRLWFAFDEASQLFYPYVLLSPQQLAFQVLSQSPAEDIPLGYEAFDFTYEDRIITAYRLAADPENPQILLYLQPSEGEAGFYLYDTRTKLFVGYQDAALAVTSPAPTVTPEASIVPSGEVTMDQDIIALLKDYTHPVAIFIYILALLCITLIILAILLWINRRPGGGGPKTGGNVPNPFGSGALDITKPQPKDKASSLPPKENRDNQELYFGDAPETELYFGDQTAEKQIQAAKSTPQDKVRPVPSGVVFSTPVPPPSQPNLSRVTAPQPQPPKDVSEKNTPKQEQ